VIELSNLKTPAWQRIVQELSAPAADDKLFLVRLISILGQVTRRTPGGLLPHPAASQRITGRAGPQGRDGLAAAAGSH
jgi:hypothetical protein